MTENKYDIVLRFKLPEGKLCYDYCRTCSFYDVSDKTPDGRCFCTRLGGYRRGSDGCGYHS